MKIHQYSLPSVKGEGWAEIMIREDGFFAAVSDYGDYAFWWTHHGKDDVRTFFVGKGGTNWEYAASKFNMGRRKEYDGDETLKNVIELIREKTVDRDEFDAHLETLQMEHENLDNEYAFNKWCESEEYDFIELYDKGECREDSYPSGLQAFCKKTLARLSEAIEAELKSEAAKSRVSGLTEEDHARINADEDACRAAYFAAQDEKRAETTKESK